MGGNDEHGIKSEIALGSSRPVGRVKPLGITFAIEEDTANMSESLLLLDKHTH